MEGITNKLQLRQHIELFDTRKDLMDYVIDYVKPEILQGEPIVLYYGTSVEPHAVLVIGCGPRRFECIDIQEARVLIQELKDCTDEQQKSLNTAFDYIKNVVDACGLDFDDNKVNDKITYKPVVSDAIISDAQTLADAVVKVSEYLQKHINDTALTVVNTPSVTLELVDVPNGGQSLQAKVNLSTDGAHDELSFNDNIIVEKTDGLFASVDLNFDPQRRELIFTTSGKENSTVKDDAKRKVISLGDHTVLEAQNLNKDIKVTVTPDGSKYIISAQAKLSEDENNILEKQDNKLFVDGRAKNIKYKGKTVFDALSNQESLIKDLRTDVDNNALKAKVQGDVTDTAEVVVADNGLGGSTIATNVRLASDESIICRDGGLGVDLTFEIDTTTNILTVKLGKKTQEIKLPGVSLFESAEYDATEEQIKIYLKGDSAPIVIPVANLVHEWVADTNNHSVQITRTFVKGGDDLVSAELVRRENNNLLSIDGTTKEVYVSPEDVIATVKPQIDIVANNLSTEIARVDNDIEKERNRANNVENGLKAMIEAEAGRASEKEGVLSNGISELNTKVSNLEIGLSEEINRAQTKEVALDTSIQNEQTRATYAEDDLRNLISVKETALTTLINAETTRAEGVEESLQTITNGLDNRLQSCENNIDTLNTKVEGVKDDLNAHILTSESDINDLKGQASAFHASIDNHETRLTVCENNVTACQNDIANVYTKAEVDLQHNLLATKSDVDTKFNSINDINNDHNARINELERHQLIVNGDSSNIISKNSSNEIYANVTLSYDDVTNTLIFNNGKESYSWTLAPGALLNNESHYDSAQESLVLCYDTPDGQKGSIVIPVRGLIDEWNVEEKTYQGIKLTRNSSEEGNTDILRAELMIRERDNLLSIDDTTQKVYVSSDAVNAAVKDQVDAVTSNLSPKIATIDNKLTLEINRANNVENGLKVMIEAETSRAKDVEGGLNAMIESEINRATANEGVIINKLNQTYEVLATKEQLNNMGTSLTLSDESIRENIRDIENRQITELRDKIDAHDNEISDCKAKISNVIDTTYTKSEIDNVHGRLIDKIDVNKEEFTNKISTINTENATRDARIDVIEGNQLNVKTDAANIISKDSITNEIYANVTLSYDEATNKLTFDNGKNMPVEIQLTGVSVVESAMYDSATKSIVLIIREKDATREVRIPASEFVKVIKFNNQPSEAVYFDVTTNVNGEETVTPHLRISDDPHNMLHVNSSVLSVSDKADDHTVHWEGEDSDISLQEAITRLKTKAENLDSTTSDITATINRLNDELNTTKSDIAQIQTAVAILNDFVNDDYRNAINNITQTLTNMNTTIQRLEDRINVISSSGSGSVSRAEFNSLSTHVDEMQESLDNLIDFGTTED